MSAPRTFNVFCNESCHLEHDQISLMAWGAVIEAARRAETEESKKGAERQLKRIDPRKRLDEHQKHRGQDQ